MTVMNDRQDNPAAPQVRSAATGGGGRRLFIHIGSHKTGTTTLQVALRKAQSERRLGPWTYVHPDSAASFNSLVHVGGRGARMRARIKLELLDRLLPATGDCVISTEMLFWVDDPAQIQALADHLRPRFDEIRVIAYLRRQDALALSHRKQVLMGATACNFYGVQLKAMPDYQPHMQRYFDYAAKLGHWQAAFGSDSLIVRRFQPKDLVGGDTVMDFWQILGLSDVPTVRRANEAWSRSQILAGLWLRARNHHRDTFVPTLLKIRDPEALRPARAEATAFLANFAAANAALKQTYDPDGPVGFFDADMTRYPEIGNDDPAAIGIDFEALEAGLSPAPARRGRRSEARHGDKTRKAAKKRRKGRQARPANAVEPLAGARRKGRQRKNVQSRKLRPVGAAAGLTGRILRGLRRLLGR